MQPPPAPEHARGDQQPRPPRSRAIPASTGRPHQRLPQLAGAWPARAQARRDCRRSSASTTAEQLNKSDPRPSAPGHRNESALPPPSSRRARSAKSCMPIASNVAGGAQLPPRLAAAALPAYPRAVSGVAGMFPNSRSKAVNHPANSSAPRMPQAPNVPSGVLRWSPSTIPRPRRSAGTRAVIRCRFGAASPLAAPAQPLESCLRPEEPSGGAGADRVDSRGG